MVNVPLVCDPAKRHFAVGALVFLSFQNIVDIRLRVATAVSSFFSSSIAMVCFLPLWILLHQLLIASLAFSGNISRYLLTDFLALSNTILPCVSMYAALVMRAFSLFSDLEYQLLVQALIASLFRA